MSDEELSPEEALLKQQRKEKKDLQATIQSLKKTASKGDKKKKKEVTEEIAKLEADLNAKHDKELQELKTKPNAEDSKDQVEDLGQDLEQVEIKEKKVSKAQKRRDKKAEKEKERLEDIAKQEEANKNGLRHLESQKIKAILAARQLQINEIPSDGDCLFAGVLHQLSGSGNITNVPELRQLTGQTLLKFKDDFQPFLSLEDSAYEDYCHKMSSTPKWGGQVEISAMSKALRIPIEVIQAEGPPVQIGHDEFKNEKAVILTYHRHYYGLGEHYNSVKPLEKDEEQ